MCRHGHNVLSFVCFEGLCIKDYHTISNFACRRVLWDSIHAICSHHPAIMPLSFLSLIESVRSEPSEANLQIPKLALSRAPHRFPWHRDYFLQSWSREAGVRIGVGCICAQSTAALQSAFHETPAGIFRLGIAIAGCQFHRRLFVRS